MLKIITSRRIHAYWNFITHLHFWHLILQCLCLPSSLFVSWPLWQYIYFLPSSGHRWPPSLTEERNHLAVVISRKAKICKYIFFTDGKVWKKKVDDRRNTIVHFWPSDVVLHGFGLFPIPLFKDDPLLW